MFFSLGRRLLAGRDGIRLTEQLVGEGLDHLERLAWLTDPLLCLSKANEELTRLLSQLKVSLYGDAGKPLRPVVLLADAQLPLLLELNCPPGFFPTENDASPEVVAQLAQEMYMHDVLLLLVERIGVFEFEVRPPQPKSTCATLLADQALSLFPIAGQEGRHADLQPPPSSSDRLQIPYGRVHHKEASGCLCYAQGVSRLLTA